MRHRPNLSAEVLMVLAVGLFLFPAQALAYLAPGMGSYAIQLSSAAVVGALLAVRLAWDVVK